MDDEAQMWRDAVADPPLIGVPVVAVTITGGRVFLGIKRRVGEQHWHWGDRDVTTEAPVWWAYLPPGLIVFGGG